MRPEAVCCRARVRSVPKKSSFAVCPLHQLRQEFDAHPSGYDCYRGPAVYAPSAPRVGGIMEHSQRFELLSISRLVKEGAEIGYCPYR
jgi:hypothetical protein